MWTKSLSVTVVFALGRLYPFEPQITVVGYSPSVVFEVEVCIHKKSTDISRLTRVRYVKREHLNGDETELHVIMMRSEKKPC